MDDFGSIRFEGSENTLRKKRTQTSRRPEPEAQQNSDEDHSPANKKTGLQGVPWKDFSKGGFSLGLEDTAMQKNIQSTSAGKQGAKSERVRKKQRVLKKLVLDENLDDADDEIRYLEKLKSVKVAAVYTNFDENSTNRNQSLSVASKAVKPDELTSLTSRQKALLSDGDSSQTEFPNGLPPAPPRRQKAKLSEVELQLKKAEAAERRRMQNEKAARETEAEAIRKILGQDSSRKKREDKLKKRREELAQEKAANAKMLAPNTVRMVFGPNGTVVSFAENIGLPHIFDRKPCCYPPPRSKCVGPSCSNPYKYRDSKSNLPLCSLQCYKASHQGMQTAY